MPESPVITIRLRPEDIRRTLQASMGKANWVWDTDLRCHIPRCPIKKKNLQICDHGPLKGEQIQNGDCGDSHA